MATKNNNRTSTIAAALVAKDDAVTNKAAHPRHREYSGIPEVGYLRISQIARNPKKPDTPAPIPVSPVTIWRWVAAGKFPKPIKLSGNVTAWKAEEVRTWMDQQAVA